jgi:hypothetical protein
MVCELLILNNVASTSQNRRGHGMNDAWLVITLKGGYEIHALRVEGLSV